MRPLTIILTVLTDGIGILIHVFDVLFQHFNMPEMWIWCLHVCVYVCVCMGVTLLEGVCLFENVDSEIFVSVQSFYKDLSLSGLSWVCCIPKTCVCVCLCVCVFECVYVCVSN